MFPVLFSLGPVTFYTFGFFMAVSFLVASFIIWNRLMELGLKEEKIIDGIIVITGGGLLFSRLFFILSNFQNFGTVFSRWIFLGRYPGLSLGGGIGGIILGLIWFCRQQKWDFWRVADEVVFGVLPLLILIQIGAFFDGSGAGKPTSMPWGVFFPGSLVRQHPASLFAAFLLLIGWMVLLKVEKQWRTWSWCKNQSPGFLAISGLGLVFLVNLIIAFLREEGVYFYWITEIIFSLLIIIVSGILIWKRRQ